MPLRSPLSPTRRQSGPRKWVASGGSLTTFTSSITNRVITGLPESENPVPSYCGRDSVTYRAKSLWCINSVSLTLEEADGNRVTG